MSDKLEQFKSIFFTPPSYVVMEGFSTHILTLMDETERQEAERLLLEALSQGTRDTRVMQGLAELMSRAALPLIRRLLPPPDDDSAMWVRYPGVLIDAALALWKIDRDPSVFRYLATIVRKGEDEFVLIHACAALRHFPFRQTIEVLRPRLTDTHSLVRHHAAFAMMLAAGLAISEIELPEPTIRIMHDDARNRGEAISELESALRDVMLPSLPGME